jgi:hypothetical protein
MLHDELIYVKLQAASQTLIHCTENAAVIMSKAAGHASAIEMSHD